MMTPRRVPGYSCFHQFIRTRTSGIIPAVGANSMAVAFAKDYFHEARRGLGSDAMMRRHFHGLPMLNTRVSRLLRLITLLQSGSAQDARSIASELEISL